MAKKLKMTFERGGVIYADLLEKEAPKTVEIFCKSLPITYPMYHGRYAGPAMFFDTNFTGIEGENFPSRKYVGMLTMTLGNKNHPHHAVHMFYSYKRPIESSNNEIHFAQVPAKYFDELEEIGERVWRCLPENVTIELVEED
ncbi:MAG: DUF3830 family protein [Oscillospiraceae bacterium]|nr:DUF3830 family protein [Oscillospiraceae bacterium]